jgi:hypothetical protein
VGQKKKAEIINSQVKWKGKQNLQEPLGHSKAALRGKFIAMSAYI